MIISTRFWFQRSKVLKRNYQEKISTQHWGWY